MWYEKYLGNNFEEKGRGPDFFDCWGLLRWVYMHDHPQKIELPSYVEFYESTNDGKTLGRVIEEHKKERWREVEKPEIFDAILIRMLGFPMHVGIVIDDGIMLHCQHGVGTAIEKFDSIKWRSKILGFYRYE